jgi:cytoskeleton protein RodZ
MNPNDQMTQIGEQLKQGRLRQKLSIAECAKRTHISARYLEAIEAERWADLPSESHRLGFLKLYSRFLGVAVDDAALSQPVDSQSAEGAMTPAKPAATPSVPVSEPKSGWSPASWAQLVILAFALLGLTWALYHMLRSPTVPEAPASTWKRTAPREPRLVPPTKPVNASQKLRVKAEADSWLRVIEKDRLLFEGILPATAVKEWSGTGPFSLRLGNARALSVFWNDQPVEIPASTRGAMNEFQLPLAAPPPDTKSAQ